MTLDLDHLSKLAEAATPGPWEIIGAQGTSVWAKDGIVATPSGSRTYHAVARANGEFIASANPATVQELIRLARIGMSAEATSSPPAA